MNEYMSFMIDRETSKVKSTDAVVAAFKNIAPDQPYLKKIDVLKNLNKDQAKFVMANMKPYCVDGVEVPDTFDYQRFISENYL